MDGTGIDGPTIPVGAAPLRVVVTGAGGFIGGHLVRALLDAGYRVGAITRGAANRPHLPPAAADKPRTGGTGVAPLILATEILPHPGTAADADWLPLLTGADAVVHLAGMAHLPLDTRETRRRLRRINVESTQRLAEAAAAAGIATFVFMSSIKAVSDHSEGTPLTEADRPGPEDCYGAAKLAAERRLQRLGRNTPRMRILILRPPLVYGPGAGANFAAFARLVGRGLPLPLAGVRNRRSLIYVGNLVDAVLRCLQRPGVPSGIFHLSDGTDVSTPGLARAIAGAQDRQARLFALPVSWLTLAARAAGRHAQISRLTGSLEVSNRHFCRSFDWHPPFTLEQGLRATLQKTHPR